MMGSVELAFFILEFMKDHLFQDKKQMNTKIMKK